MDITIAAHAATRSVGTQRQARHIFRWLRIILHWRIGRGAKAIRASANEPPQFTYS